ncbi:MAG: hypothetical protein ACLRPX_09165 [Ruthenibacterium sp.]
MFAGVSVYLFPALSAAFVAMAISFSFRNFINNRIAYDANFIRVIVLVKAAYHQRVSNYIFYVDPVVARKIRKSKFRPRFCMNETSSFVNTVEVLLSSNNNFPLFFLRTRLSASGGGRGSAAGGASAGWPPWYTHVT